MVKLLQFSDEPENLSSHLSNGASCSNEAAQASVKMNGNIHSTKDTTGNGSCKVPFEEIPLVNSDKVSVNLNSTFNGHCNKMTVKNTPMLNGDCENKMPINDALHDRNHDDKAAAEEIPSLNGIYNKDKSNGSSSVSENSIQDDSDENQNGFIQVVSKKKRNRNKKSISNLPPGRKVESIRHDNGDKNHEETKLSPSHTALKPPTRTVFAVRSSGKSYSSALINGQNMISQNSQLRNFSQFSSDSQTKAFSDVTKCTKLSKASNNCDLGGTCVSLDQLSIEPAKSAVINDTLAVSCEQKDLSTKVKVSDFCGQTDLCFTNEIIPSQKEHLPFNEDEAQESVTASSPIDYVDEDVREVTDGSPNITYCDSVVSNDSGRGDSEVPDKEIFSCQFPKAKAPLLIGRRGNYKLEVEGKTGVKIEVKNIENADFVIVKIKGTVAQIEKAKEIISERFHIALRQFFGFTEWDLLSAYYIARLPEETDFPGTVSFMFNPGFFWVQQHGHPLQYQLEDLERRMSHHYNTVPDVPRIDCPEIGNVIAVEGDESKWLRGSIMHIYPEAGELLIRYMDHGGDYRIPIDKIRPLRHEFFSMPFFAAQCSLFGVLPAGDMWSQEAVDEFARLCFCSHHPTTRVTIKIAGGSYYVMMRVYDYERNAVVDFGAVLIEKGLAVVDPQFFQPPDLQ